jgi:hypothetical protein
MRDILLKNEKVAIPSRELGCSVRVAAVGCGYWGKNLVRNFAQLDALAAICDPNRAAADELAKHYRAPVAEFEAVLRDANSAGWQSRHRPRYMPNSRVVLSRRANTCLSKSRVR